MVGAFSFPKSQRSDPKKDPTPGVGNYDPDRPTNMKPPTWKIGSEQRGKLGLIRAPGPGQYEQKEDVIRRKKPEFSFGGKYYHQTASQITPGPGAYDPDERKLLQSASSFSIRPRLQPGGVDDYLRETRNGPGPAAYETNYSTLYRPSSRIGNQSRDGLYNTSKWVPGVGNYNVRPQTSGPFHRFGGALRDNQFIKDKMTPGPGEYMIQSTLNTKATTMSTKRLGTGADSGPGPGQYDPSVILTKRGQPYVGIGTGIQRQNFGRSQTPGPGEYTHQNPNKRRPPSYKMGLETRKIVDQQEVPGPGTYDVSRDLTGKSYTLRPKYTDRVKEGTPGPLDYNPSLTQTKLRPSSCRVGTEQRLPTQTKEQQQNPAPGHYQVLLGNSGPKFPFGTESKQFEKGQLQNPGPGQYTLPPYFGNVPSYLVPK